MEINVTFLMGNEVLNIFSSNNFFEKSNIFGENGRKHFRGTWPFFRRRGHLTLKMNITCFIENWLLNIFMLNNFFGKSSIF